MRTTLTHSAAVLIGLVLGIGVSYLGVFATRPTTLVAIIPEHNELRAELAKNPAIRTVDQRFIIEGRNLRKDEEPELTRNRKVCQELGVKLIVEIEAQGKSGWVRIIEVDSGALLWTNGYSDDLLRYGVVEAVNKRIP